MDVIAERSSTLINRSPTTINAAPHHQVSDRFSPNSSQPLSACTVHINSLVHTFLLLCTDHYKAVWCATVLDTSRPLSTVLNVTGLLYQFYSIHYWIRNWSHSATRSCFCWVCSGSDPGDNWTPPIRHSRFKRNVHKWEETLGKNCNKIIQLWRRSLWFIENVD